jgi:ketosteroid isomerase-like protein
MKSLIALAVIAATLTACGEATPPQPSFADDLAAITVFNERYLGSINDEDIGALSDLTNDDHVMIPPNRPPIVGKAANDAANGRAFEEFRFDEQWHPVETVISGDLAFQRGTYTTTAMPRGSGKTRTINGNFLRIYQRQADGAWRMTHDTFNVESSQAN